MFSFCDERAVGGDGKWNYANKPIPEDIAGTPLDMPGGRFAEAGISVIYPDAGHGQSANGGGTHKFKLLGVENVGHIKAEHHVPAPTV